MDQTLPLDQSIIQGVTMSLYFSPYSFMLLPVVLYGLYYFAISQRAHHR